MRQEMANESVRHCFNAQQEGLKLGIAWSCPIKLHFLGDLDLTTLFRYLHFG